MTQRRLFYQSRKKCKQTTYPALYNGGWSINEKKNYLYTKFYKNTVSRTNVTLHILASSELC